MAKRFTSISVSPTDGGRLMSRVSASEAGLSNYKVKRDFRRDSDYEMRREGYDYFGDLGSLSVGTQPFPAGVSSTDEITLVHLSRSTTGKTQVVVGTKTALYLYNALEGDYVSDPNSANNPYFDVVNVVGGTEPYFGDVEWKQIGSGFSSSGRRWEAVNVSGYTIFNNGVDLPVHWRIGQTSVTPMHELRDLSIASVGTIAAFNNILMLGDIREIPAASHTAWMNGSTPYGMYSEGLATDKYQYRLLWSVLDKPTEFGVPVSGTTTSSSTTLTLDFPSESFVAGDEVVVLGAAVAGGNLYTTISSISGTTVVLSDAASTATSSAILQKQSAVGSITGFDDLQDDASGIVKMGELMGQLVIYKDTSNFLARYTGVPTSPFSFARIGSSEGKGMYYKNTLVNVDGKYHVYAGRNGFYRFDLQNRQPKELAVMDLCSDIFFDSPDVNIGNSDKIFSSFNTNTSEVWFMFPSSTDDKAICLDTRYQTVSTTSIDVTAAASVKRPTINIQPVETEDWFVMGTSDGVLLTYGKVDKPLSWWSNKDEIFYRRKSKTDTTTKTPYSSVLSSGLGDFGDQFNEKDIRSYLPNLSSKQEGLTNLGISVSIFSANTQATQESLSVGPVSVDEPEENSIALFARAHNFRDEITVSGKDNPVRLASRTYEVSKVGSRSAIRRDD